MIPTTDTMLKARSSKLHCVARTAKLDRARDAMGGKFSAKKGSHPIQKIIRMESESPTKTAADNPPVIVRQSLVLAGLAGHSDSKNIMASVVYGNDLSLPRWRDALEPVRFAYMIAAEMKRRRSENQPHSQSYVAISLNLSEDSAKLAPDELKDSIRKRLHRALGEDIPFVLERDKDGRTHCHAIYFGYLTPNQRKKLKAAGGKWSGTDSRKQLVAKERNSFEGAIGWACWYMLQDRKEGAVLYIPNRMRKAGRELYEQTRQLVEESTSQASKSEAGNTLPDTPAKTKVLEKNDRIQPEREKTGTAISKSGIASNQSTPGVHSKCAKNASETHKARNSAHGEPVAIDELKSASEALEELHRMMDGLNAEYEGQREVRHRNVMNGLGDPGCRKRESSLDELLDGLDAELELV